MSTNGEAPSRIVVVGASAGGIDALGAFLKGLPDDFSAAVVVAQHLDPHRESHLVDILSRRTTLQVRSVARSVRLEAGIVYLAPPDADVEVSRTRVRKMESPGGRSQPSVDRLLASAAKAFEENAIAVILSGSGSDGAFGARTVKAAGGVVLVQDAESAAFAEMPTSLAPTTVDVVATADAMGSLVAELVSGRYEIGASDDEQLMESLFDELRQEIGINFSSYKQPTLRRRLRSRMAAVRAATLTDYVRLLRRDQDERQRLVSSFLIKVTDFFRDRELFDHLRRKELPRLVAARTDGRDLRFWSAGCATGEEAYSLAILVAELIEQTPDLKARIFATDLDPDAIAFARRGVYPASALADVPDDLLERYFTKLDGEYEVKSSIRGLITFGQHDLPQRAPFARIDLALCRNVLIYFSRELQRRTLQLFGFAVRENGFLVLGKTETAAPGGNTFVLEDPHLKIYRRKPGMVPIPTSPLEPRPVYAADDAPRRERASVRLATGFGRGVEQRQPLLKSRADSVLLHLHLGVILVNREYDIESINTAARKAFDITTPAIGQDLVHLVDVIPSDWMRHAIDAAFNERESTRGRHEVRLNAADEERRWLEVACEPARADGDTIDIAVVTVRDVSAEEHALARMAEEVASHRDRLGRIERRAEELRLANERLRRANEELTVVNAELRTGNEELMVSNEEVQAASEEVETLNEELQATNEELETLNEELQATNEELNTTNEDLNARTGELQDLAMSVERERNRVERQRERLGMVLSSIGEGIVFVSEDGSPVVTNAAYDQLFASPTTYEGESGKALPPEARPQQRAGRGEQFSMHFAIETGEGRRWLEAYGQPITDPGEAVGVVVFRDVTEHSLRRMQEEFMSVASHELRTPLTALHGYLQMALRVMPEDNGDRSREFVERAEVQSGRLRDLIAELIDATRANTGKLIGEESPFDLRDAARDAGEIARTLTQQTVNIVVPDDPITVKGDLRRIQQAILNLLTNAIRHAPQSPSIDLSVTGDSEMGRISVKDTGPGIPKAMRSRLFKRFEQESRGEGLGLGLYLVSQIASAHSGRVSFVSNGRDGSTFVIELPVARGS